MTFARFNMVHVVVFLGILLRLLLFPFLAPLNSDNHYVVIEHIMEHRELVPAHVYEHSFHPQLYHLLAIPFAAVGGEKGAQLLSLLLSIGTLLLLARLVSDRRLLKSEASASAALSLPAFLPSFVVFSLYVSNDTLAMFLGACLAWASWGFLQAPSLRGTLLIGVLLGLGLSTKGTFLALLPPIGLLLLWGMWSIRLSPAVGLRWLLACGVAVLLLGSYKFIENQVQLGKPVAHNLDPDPYWADAQRPVYVGAQSFLDVNIAKLLREPSFSFRTKHSIPLLLYGSFWTKFWPTENNFRGHDTAWLRAGTALVLLGLLPTLAIAFGGMRTTVELWRSASKPEVATVYQFLMLSAFLWSLALVVLVGLRYDVASCFQSRLVYAGFPGLMLSAGVAIDACRPGGLPARVLSFGFLFAALASLVYFLGEISLLLR